MLLYSVKPPSTTLGSWPQMGPPNIFPGNTKALMPYSIKQLGSRLWTEFHDWGQLRKKLGTTTVSCWLLSLFITIQTANANWENVKSFQVNNPKVPAGKKALHRKRKSTRQVLGRPVCDRGAIPRTLVQSNVVRSRIIILINEEINEANWMVSNSAKLDRRTKQHTQFGVSASNGSRDMARTKSWRKKIKKK